MKFNTKESIRIEVWLFNIPIMLLALWRVIQFQIIGIPLPKWTDYAFPIYLTLGFIYFGFLHKSNKE